MKRLANDEFFNFAEFVVGDADEVGTLGEVAEVDDLSIFSIDVLVVDHAAAHVDEHAVDHTVDTVDGEVNNRGGGVGLEVHANASCSGIDGVGVGSRNLTRLVEDEVDGVVSGHTDEGILISAGVGVGVDVNFQVRVTFFGIFVPGLNFHAVDDNGGGAVSVGATGDGGGGAISRSDGDAASGLASIGCLTVVGGVAGDADVVTLDFLTRSDNHTDHRIGLVVEGESRTVAFSTVGRIKDVVLILVAGEHVGKFGGGFVVAEVDDGVISVRTSGGGYAVAAQSFVSESEETIFFHAVTNTIAGVGFKSGLLGEGDVDGVVVAKVEPTGAVAADDGAVVDIVVGDGLHVSTSEDSRHVDRADIEGVFREDGGNLRTAVVVVGHRRSNELDTVDDPVGGDFGIGGITGVDHVASLPIVNFVLILGDIPSAARQDVAIQPVVVGHVGQNAVIVAPTVFVAVESAVHTIEEGVVINGGAVAGDSSIDVVVTHSGGGQVDTRAMTELAKAVPATIVHGVSKNPTLTVDDDFFGVVNAQRAVVVGVNLGGNILSGVEVIELGVDVVLGHVTNVLDLSVPSGVDFQALRDDGVVTFDIFFRSIFLDAVGTTGSELDIVEHPEVAVSSAGIAVEGFVTNADAEVGRTSSSGRQGVGVHAPESTVDFDIDTTDVDFHLIPGGVVAATVDVVVDVAVVVVFTIVLEHGDIDDVGRADVNAVEKDVGVEVTGVCSALVVHGHHHEAVLSRGNSGVGIVYQIRIEVVPSVKIGL